ncbi:restriction endonuclease subunit S [Lactococcus lactis]|uniref:restriction endonuclease subunit S n=1 Tax=Lactococcus lactis TaxID=1358 RepID=UPI003D177960
MSKNKKLVPKRRFKEFQNSDAWEQRELGEVVQITMGQSPLGSNYTENPSDYILVQGNADMKNGKVFPRIWTTQVTKTAEPDDIILSVRAPVGDVGKTDYNVVLGRGVAGIKGNEFIYQLLSKMKSNSYWGKYSTGSTFDSINSNDLKEANICIPSTNEQVQIGSFFRNLDQTIAFQQRKLEKMKSMKSAYLSEMFPAEGERKPKRRFPGFTDDWEQRKLEDMCSLITKQTGFDYSATIKPSLINKKNDSTYSFIQNKDFSGLNINLNTDFYIPVKIAEKFPRILLDQPSLLVTISGKIGNLGLYNDVKKAFIGGAVGICKLNDLKEGEFILYELTSEFGQRQFRKSTKTSSHANITVEMIKDIDIIIPKSHIEHNKISKFFKQLDTTIAFQQQKLEKLQNIKKAYLNEMFI